MVGFFTDNELTNRAEVADRYAKGQMELYDGKYKDNIFHQNVKIIIDGENVSEDFLRHVQGLYEGCRKFRVLKNETGWPTTSEEIRRRDAWDRLQERCEKDETLKEMWDEIMVMGKLMED